MATHLYPNDVQRNLQRILVTTRAAWNVQPGRSAPPRAVQGEKIHHAATAPRGRLLPAAWSGAGRC